LSVAGRFLAMAEVKVQELFWFLIDQAAIFLIEREAMENKDFVRTENYSLRMRPTGAKKVIDNVNAWLNKTVNYEGNECAFFATN
jgi:CRISPR-associated protein Cas1